MTKSSDGYPILQVKVTEEEREAIFTESLARGITMSDLVRHRLGMRPMKGIILNMRGVVRHIREDIAIQSTLCGAPVSPADVVQEAFEKLVLDVQSGKTKTRNWNICLKCRAPVYDKMGIIYPGKRSGKVRAPGGPTVILSMERKLVTADERRKPWMIRDGLWEDKA